MIIQDRLYVDNTMLSNFWRCPMFFFWRHVTHLESTEVTGLAAHFGIAFHAGVEHRENGASVDEAVQIAKEMFEPLWTVLEDLYTPLRLGDLLRYYFEYYEDSHIQILENEMPFEVELSPTLSWCGRVDRVVELNGVVMGADTKTTRMPQSIVASPNGQFTGYLYALRKLRPQWDVKMFMIDLVGVYKTKPRKAKDGVRWLTGAGPEEAFFRYIVQRTEEQLREWEVMTQHACELIRKCIDGSAWPMNTRSCYMFGRECPYRPLCQAPPSSRGELSRSSMYQQTVWYPSDNLEGRYVME